MSDDGERTGDVEQRRREEIEERIERLEQRIERLSQDLDEASQNSQDLLTANGFLLRRVEHLEQIITQYIGPQT